LKQATFTHQLKVVDALFISRHKGWLDRLQARGVQFVDRTLFDVLSHNIQATFVMIGAKVWFVSLGWLDHDPAFGELLQSQVRAGRRVLRVKEAVKHERAQGGGLPWAVDQGRIRFWQSWANLLPVLRAVHDRVMIIRVRVEPGNRSEIPAPGGLETKDHAPHEKKGFGRR